MKKSLLTLAASAVASAALVATPSVASTSTLSTVLYPERSHDSQSLVASEVVDSPYAGIDLISAKSTVTKTHLVVNLNFRNITRANLDQVFFNWDTDGDQSPDYGVRWYASLPDDHRLVAVHGAFYDSWGTVYQSSDFIPCDVTLFTLYDFDLVQIRVPKSCLAAEGVTKITGFQSSVYDSIMRDNSKGQWVSGRWDFIGGESSTVARKQSL